jgi:putative transposase
MPRFCRHWVNQSQGHPLKCRKRHNYEHYHSGIGLLTPASVHNGTAGEIIAARQSVLDDAFDAHPERFRRGRPTAAAPEPAWINKPADTDQKQKEAVTQ